MHVVITGANRGIGQALDTQLRKAGHKVTGTARAGGEYLGLDVTIPGDFDTLSAALDSRPVDLLVCNAGIYPDKRENLAEGYPAPMWAECFATNVTGVFLTVQALLPNLQLSQTPKIAIIASKMGSQKLAPGGAYIYRASKAATLNLGRNLAQDLRHIGIAVGIYHPGWVRTDMGGSKADISATESAGGLMRRFDELDLTTSGCFQAWDGQKLPL